MVTTGREEALIANRGVTNIPSSDDGMLLTEQPRLQEKVDLIIHESLSDLWLMLTGEELEETGADWMTRDGRAFAMVCPGAIHILGSRLAALRALRSVGIEMS